MKMQPKRKRLNYKEIAITFFLLFIFSLISITCNAQHKTLRGNNLSQKELDTFLEKQMDSLKIPGLSFALINKGKVVYQQQLGVENLDTKEPLTDKSIFEAASLSKTVFTYFVLKQVEKGLLNLDTPLYKYMPYPDIATDERYKLITARMVLSHTTGFPNWRYFDKPWEGVKYGDLYLKFTPGTQFAYSGEGYLYLAKVIAHLNKLDLTTLDNLFQKEVAKPLNMKHAWFSWNDYLKDHMLTGHKEGKVFLKRWPTSFPTQDSTTFGPAGGLHTEVSSYDNFLIALLQEKGLTKNSFAEMFKPQVKMPKESNYFIQEGISA